jgi:Flp pilus assembly protein TadG
MRCDRRHVKHDARRTRRGTATAELAVCIPVIVSLVLGALETANVVFLKQAIVVAAYEAAQRASARGGVESNAIAAGEAVFTAHHVTGGSIDVNPPVTTQTPAGTEIVVTATAPLSGATFVYRFFAGESSLSTTVTMVRL